MSINMRPGPEYDESYKLSPNNIYKCTSKNIKEIINQIISQKPNEKVLIELPNTIGLTDDIINLLTDNMEIKILGGYFDVYGESFKSYRRYQFDEMKAKAVYSKKELMEIYNEIKIIESGIDPKWNEYEKALYLYEYLKFNTVYREPPQVQDGHNSERTRTWDSLMGLTTHLSTCAGYSFIYQELCTRQNIECVCVGHTNHAWNAIKINNQDFFVDIIWDSIKYRENKDETTYFGFDYLEKEKEYPKRVTSYTPRGPQAELLDTVKVIDPKWVESAKKKVTANMPKKEQNEEKILKKFKETQLAEKKRMYDLRNMILGKEIKKESRPISI